MVKFRRRLSQNTFLGKGLTNQGTEENKRRLLCPSNRDYLYTIESAISARPLPGGQKDRAKSQANGPPYRFTNVTQGVCYYLFPERMLYDWRKGDVYDFMLSFWQRRC